MKQLSRKSKLAQLETTMDNIQMALRREGYLLYKDGIFYTDDEDLKNRINCIDITKYMGIELGQGINCLRVSCNNSYGANFFKSGNTTLYKCHIDCNCVIDTITLFDLIVEIYKQQRGVMDYNVALRHIKMDFMPNYESEFYKEFREIVEHNRKMIENLHHRKYLSMLFKRRKLMEFYYDFTELALIYMKEDEEIPYSFYASNSVVKRTYTYVFGKNGSNYTLDKANILVALGLVEKLDEDNCSKRMRAKIVKAKMLASANSADGKTYIKTTSAYRLRKLTLEDINNAEKVAKFILENKIYTIKPGTFKEIEKSNKKRDKANETFVKRAKKAIKEELKKKDYIQLHKVVSKIDPKNKYYNKAQKEQLFEENLRRICNDYKLDIIVVDSNARKAFSLTRSVKDGAKLLIKKNNTKLNARLKIENDEEIVEIVETNNGKSESVKVKKILTDNAPF